MKTNSNTIAMMMLVLFIASCNNKDARMLTVINEDGTCSREYSFHTNEKELMIPQEEDFDSLIDKHWERTWSMIGSDSLRHPVPITKAQLDSLQELNPDKELSDSLMVHVKKQFATVQDMSDHLLKAVGEKLQVVLHRLHLHRDVRLRRSGDLPHPHQPFSQCRFRLILVYRTTQPDTQLYRSRTERNVGQDRGESQPMAKRQLVC